jgi:signal peptidase I
MSEVAGEAVAAPRSGLRRFWEEFGTFAVAILLALSIRAFVIEPYRIPSESMLPTLLIGDHLFVNKFVYGIKVPFTDLRFPGLREPERGDVVVFTVARDARGGIFPADQRPELSHDQFVKRLIGLPGDVVEVRAGELFVNGARIEHEDTGATFADKDGRELRVGRERLPGHEHSVLDEPRSFGPELRPLTIPEGRYLMMGDNRDYSNDSRIWGTVRKAEMKGPAFVLYWSWDWDGPWLDLLKPTMWWELMTSRMRWERIGDSIE